MKAETLAIYKKFVMGMYLASTTKGGKRYVVVKRKPVNVTILAYLKKKGKIETTLNGEEIIVWMKPHFVAGINQWKGAM
jgi:hypothetical protein